MKAVFPDRSSQNESWMQVPLITSNSVPNESMMTASAWSSKFILSLHLFIHSFKKVRIGTLLKRFGLNKVPMWIKLKANS